MKVGNRLDDTCNIGRDDVDDFSGPSTDAGQNKGFAVDQDGDRSLDLLLKMGMKKREEVSNRPCGQESILRVSAWMLGTPLVFICPPVRLSVCK